MTIFSKLTSAFKSLPFSAYGGSGYGGGASYVPGVSLTGSGFPGAGLPGTNYDYKTAAGVLWQNPSAAACFVALTKAFAQSRPVLERRDGKQWQQVDEHALLDLLNVPNEFYSGERLFGVTLISTMANGAGYWRIERDRKGDPAELWFEPPSGVGPTGIAPAWDEEHFIREYFYFIDGKRHGEPLPRADVVYFRHGLNPANSREPWAPLSLAAREIATLNSASTYTGALLRNSAVPSGMVTLEGSSLASGTPPTPEQAEEMKRRIKAGFKGDQVGEPFVSSLPWKWTPFNWSPEQLNISKLQTWPQGMVCALLGTPEIVALLPTGEQPTYQNLAASMEWWWNNTVIPLEDAFADEIETQLFPAFGLDRHEYRLTWDRSQVPALQEDEIAKHQMVREDYRAGVIDLFTATVQLGGEAVEDMRGVYHPSAAPKGDNSKEIKGIDRNGMSHGRDGRFDGGRGSDVHSASIGSDRQNSDISGGNSGSSGDADGGPGGRKRSKRRDRRNDESGNGSAPHPSHIWGGDERDETTKRLFNGKFEVTISDPQVHEISKDFFGRALADQEYGELIGLPDGENIRVDAKDGALVITSDAKGYFSMLIRTVGQEGKQIYLDNSIFAKNEHTPARLAPRMLAYEFKKAWQLGIKQVRCHAAGRKGSYFTGYSRWPQLGFNAQIDSVLKQNFPPEFQNANDLNELVRMPGGLEQLEIHGDSIDLIFDLTPNSSCWQIFSAYLKDKKIQVYDE